MQQLLPAVDSALLVRELTPDRLLRKANNGGNEIYHFFGSEAPHAMRELGRLREEAFRDAGGGTGKELDIDDFDLGAQAYKQLVVWDPVSQLILGGYRYSVPSDDPAESVALTSMGATRELFDFSDRFVRDYLPWTIELGRSFVRVRYQSSSLRRKSLFVLDNLWDGLGALVCLYPRIEGFFGKVTMYPHYNAEARDILLYFLGKYFPDPDELVRPRRALPIRMDSGRLSEILHGADYREDFELLTAALQARGERVPPLIKSYIGLSRTMRVFGTALNADFGNVEETGIMVRIGDIFEEKIRRHVDTYHGCGRAL